MLRHLASMFCVSAGVLLFEVALTRIFTLTFWHHFSSILIALAMAGFGIAGSVLTLIAPRLEQRRKPALVITAAAAAAAMPLAYIGALSVELEPLALAWSLEHWRRLAAVLSILMAPFIIGAAHIGLTLAWSDRPGHAYAANLIGSACGCLAALGILSFAGPQQAVYPAAGLAALGAAIHLGPKSLPLLLAVALPASFYPLPLRFAEFKDRSAVLAARGGSRESHLTGLRGLVEVIGGPAFHYAPGMSLNCPHALPAQRGLFLDGDLVGPIIHDSRLPANTAFTDCLLLSVPLEAFPAKSILILRVGGGLGVLAALNQGPTRVIGLEENPEIYRLITDSGSRMPGAPQHHPGLILQRADPARFLGRSRERFDLIVLGDGTRWDAGSPEGQGVTRLLTVDGFLAVFERLSRNGAFVLTGPLLTPPRASIKALATAVEALHRWGASPGQGVAVVRDWKTVCLIVKPSGMTVTDIENIRRAAGTRGFDIDVLPHLRTEEINHYHELGGSPIYRAGRLLLTGRRDELYTQSFFYVEPATRDRPYFHHFFRYKTLPLVFNKSSGRPLAADEWGVLFTWGGLAFVMVVAAAGILIPLTNLRPRPPGLAFFSLIGLGYMAAEIILLSETICALGHPALAVPLVISVFLCASGLGSRLIGSMRLAGAALASAVLLAAAIPCLRHLPEHPAVIAAVIIPPAFFMGGPFAGGLIHLAGHRPQSRAWAYGVNGFFSVAGALTAGLICPLLGHAFSMHLAAACYAVAGLLSPRRVT